MSDSVSRFSNRVENYVKYRPTYPREVLQLFKDEMGLTVDSIVADIGSGPGILAKQFLENGNTVYCVEPNDAMRGAAEEILKEYSGFRSVKGDSENTTLPAGSVDIITAAQAFHWFRPEPTKLEFKRILKPGGYTALIWNVRQLDSTPFLREYEQFIKENANDYGAVRHENITESEIGAFFDSVYKKSTFGNIQVFDFEGLRGRLFSSSYMPAEGSEKGHEVERGLRELFERHAHEGKIEVLYSTEIFYSKL
jgi:ubiquinone/menaquinone biosynthesis C-methylase UbiE